jgi:hypothetical protein
VGQFESAIFGRLPIQLLGYEPKERAVTL